MKQTRLGNICEDILAHWYEKRRVNEEQADIFCEGFLDQMDSQEETVQEYNDIILPIEIDVSEKMKTSYIEEKTYKSPGTNKRLHLSSSAHIEKMKKLPY